MITAFSSFSSYLSKNKTRKKPQCCVFVDINWNVVFSRSCTATQPIYTMDLLAAGQIISVEHKILSRANLIIF